MTADEAVQLLRDGERVRMTVGTGSEDPVLILHNDGGCVVSNAVAGWSAGVEEPVCGIESGFLLTYLSGRHALERVA